MEEDPRRVLEDAARRRLPCEILPRRGVWCQGRFVRVDKAGVVLVVEGDFFGGEDVQVWFTAEDQPWTFEASVLRAGVPVPDRSQNGLMLGFIESWTRGTPQPQRADLRLTLLPPNGRGLELLGGEIRMVDLSVEEMAFVVPQAFTLKFVEGGTVRVRFSTPGQPDHLVSGQVRTLSPGDGHYLYGIAFTEVGDVGEHPRVIEVFRSVL